MTRSVKLQSNEGMPLLKLQKLVTDLKARVASRKGIIGHVDYPKEGSQFAHHLDVSGWVFSIDGGPLTIGVLANGQLIREVHPEIPRPDVRAVHPQVAEDVKLGFKTQFRPSELPSGKTLKVAVVAEKRGADGGVVRQTLGTRRVGPAGGGGVRHIRGDYSSVWDGVSTNIGDAHVSVCGTTDQAEYEKTGISTAQDVVAEAGVTGADVVLEIGCGTGRVGAKLAPRCGQWIGADVSQNMLDYAEEALGDLPNVSFRRLNGYDLEGVADESLDVVYCTGVFMHLDEWDRYRYVSEAYRVLRPGGRVYFDNVNLEGDEGWAIFLQMAEHDAATRPANVSQASTSQELMAYADRSGFQGTRVKTGPLWVTVNGAKPER